MPGGTNRCPIIPLAVPCTKEAESAKAPSINRCFSTQSAQSRHSNRVQHHSGAACLHRGKKGRSNSLLQGLLRGGPAKAGIFSTLSET
jgi:hypothetical protein